MGNEDAIRLFRAYFSSLFPRRCGNCGRRYANLKQYILETTPVPRVVGYDAEMGEWTPERPLGGMALANCACGNTMALTTAGMPLDELHRVLGWIRRESAERGISVRELLDEVRSEVRRRVMAE